MALAFLLDSVLLAAFWAAAAVAGAAVAIIATRAGPLRPPVLTPPAVAAFATAMTAASLALRFGAPDVMLEIGRRRVPLLWSIGAALVGAVACVLVRRRSAASPA
jgi:hypothetical protein